MQGQTPKTKGLTVYQKAPGDVNNSCSSKEVLASATATCRDSSLVLGNGREDGKLGIEVFSDVHDGGDITATVAVIWSRPDGNNRLLREMVLHDVSIRFTLPYIVISYLITLVYKLMGTGNELKSIDLVELGCDLVSKQPSSSTGRNGPGFHIFRITPDQITKRTLVRNLLGTGDDADLIQSADFWTQTSVNAKNGSINNSRKDKEVKNLTASLPDRRIAILLLALLIETVDLCDLTRLVVAADKGDAVRVSVIVSIAPIQCSRSTYLAFKHIRRVRVSKEK